MHRTLVRGKGLEIHAFANRLQGGKRHVAFTFREDVLPAFGNFGST